MKNTTNRQLLTIVGTILLPLIIYFVYELSTIQEEEAVIEEIYREQLDAVIFSVNQYSNDIMNGLLDKVENQMRESKMPDAGDSYLSFSNFYILLLNDLDTPATTRTIVVDSSAFSYPEWDGLNDSLLTSYPNLIEQLTAYKSNGYRKIEPTIVVNRNEKNLQVIHAVLDSKNGQVFLTGLMDIQGFAENVLAPKLQQIVEDELVIYMTNSATNEVLYQTDTLSRPVTLSKNMWLFPDYQIGVSSLNKTVSELVKDRTRNNLLAMGILITLLLFGFGLVFRNLRREIVLAQTKSDFVSNVSHELRTPLALISMFAETLMLDRVPSAEKRKEYERIIFKETNRLTNIVNKILNFSQIEANKRTYNRQPANLNEIVSELINDYSYHLEQNQFTYEVKLAESMAEVSLDKEAIYEALVNLIDNAMKYSPDRKHIILRTGNEEHRVFVEVEDQGVGIEQKKLRQIFEKFYRVTEGNVHTSRGAGLGLALVSHIVDSQEGDVEVESTLGKGSLFRIVFYLNDHG